MIASLRKLVGMRLLLALVGLFVGSLALFNVSPAHAVTVTGTATWKDKNTIVYNGVSFTGPHAMKLNIDLNGTQGDFNVFKISSGNSILFFRKDIDMNTATQVAVNNSTSAIDAALVNLTNKRTAVPDGTPPTSSTTPAASANPEVCAISGVGWIICPVATIGANITDWAYAGVEQLLKIKPFSVTDTSSTNATYTIWSGIRTIANVAFIFAFFAIIFSQTTSIGIGSYGIKKMLPRLIIAAILVNLSYFICAFAVDVSNVIGAGIDGIINTTYENITKSDTTSEFNWSTVITMAIAGAGAYAGISSVAGTVGGAAAGTSAAGAAFAMVLPFLVIALFAVFTALAVLVARQAIIILLIVIAPLAFVAYILPNTEGLFDKWRKLFTTMLVFYPLVAVIFAGSKVAAAILRDASDSNEFIRVASLGVQFFPLFALPFILKFSGGVLGRVAGSINNPNKGPFDRLRKRAEGYRDYKINNAQEKASDFRHANPTSWRGRKFGSNAKRDDAYESAKRRSTEAKQKYTNSLLQPDEDGLPKDIKFAAKMSGLNRRETQDLKNYAQAQRDRNQTISSNKQTIDEGLWAMQDDAMGYGSAENNDRIARARDAQQQYRDVTAAANSATEKLGKMNLDKAVKVMAHGQAVVDEIDIKDLKAAQSLQSNLRLNGAQLKAVLSQDIGTSVAGMAGESVLVTEAAKAAAGSTMLGQAREVNTVMKSVAQLNDKSMRSFLVGQIGNNFSAIKAKQAGMIDEGFQQKIINGEVQTEAQFNEAYVIASANKLKALTPQLYSSQEPVSIRAIEQGLREGVITGKDADTYRKLSQDTINVPTLRQLSSPESLEAHARVAAAPTSFAPASSAPTSPAPAPAAPAPGPAPTSTPLPTPATPPSPAASSAAPSMFTGFSKEDLRNMGGGGINVYVDSVGGVGKLSTDDLSKVRGALSDLGVRTSVQQNLFEQVNNEFNSREQTTAYQSYSQNIDAGNKRDQNEAFKTYGDNIRATGDRVRVERQAQNDAYDTYRDNVQTTKEREAEEQRRQEEDDRRSGRNPGA